MKKLILILVCLLILSGFTFGLSDDGYLAVGLVLKQKTYTSVQVSFTSSHKVYESLGGQVLAVIEGAHTYTATANGNEVILQSQTAPTLVLAGESRLLMPNEGGHFSVNGTTYRGGLSFKPTTSGLVLINRIKRQEYLYGVLPKEMSVNWPLEALKAQALAARTYAHNQMGRHASEGYDVCDTTHCQAYGGKSVEGEVSNAAVDQTKDELILYQNKPITAYYHSNSGGYTANSENVYMSALPYIKAVEDPYSLGQPNDAWGTSMTEQELTEKLKASNYNLGTIHQVISRQATTGGRITQLEIQGSSSNITLKNDEVRKVLGYTTIKSMLFNVSKGDTISVLSSNGKTNKSLGQVSVLSATGKVSAPLKATLTSGQSQQVLTQGTSGFTFSGRGYGHGLGMSQWGAKAMADQGLTYKDVLLHYYTGVEIGQQ